MRGKIDSAIHGIQFVVIKRNTLVREILLNSLFLIFSSYRSRSETIILFFALVRRFAINHVAAISVYLYINATVRFTARHTHSELLVNGLKLLDFFGY